MLKYSQWNLLLQDIVAIGYGEFYAIEQTPGLVCCWSIKNPTVSLPSFLHKFAFYF